MHEITPKIMVVIIDRDKTEALNKVFDQNRVLFHYACLGHGTASSEMLSLLGLGFSEKSIAICLDLQRRIPKLMDAVYQKMHLEKKGNGIVFSLPVSGINGPAYHLMDHEIKKQLEKEVEQKVEKTKITQDLILAIVNKDYSENVMDAVLKIRQTGGTVIHASRIGGEEEAHFLGISIHAEKEIVAIVVPREDKTEIMKAISHDVGMNTPAHGIVLSLPVEQVMGLNF